MTELNFSRQAPSQSARHFLDLLDDVCRIHGLFLDEIAALRARVAELEASKTPFVAGDGTIPSVPGCAIYLVSLDGTIQGWSGGAREIYGYSAEEVVGQPPDMLCPSGTSPEDSTPMAAPSLRSSRRLRKDGRVFEVHPHHAGLLDKAGRACGRIHVEIPLEADEAAPVEGGGS